MLSESQAAEPVPADIAYMEDYGRLAERHNALLERIEAGLVTADTLTAEERELAPAALAHGVKFRPATSGELWRANVGVNARGDLILLELAGESRPYRVFKAALTEGVDWVWATAPDGGFGMYQLGGDAPPLPPFTVVHRWNERGNRLDTQVDARRPLCRTLASTPGEQYNRDIASSG